MNRWLLIRRMRGPAFLLLFGVTALLHEWHILSFSQSWPLYLVLAGVLTLLERATFEQPDPGQVPPPYSYPQTGYPQTGYQQPSYPGQPAPGWTPTGGTVSGTAIVPSQPGEIEPTEGGR